ncbi:MAG: hypothetical protein FWE24_04830 [Defluviitaleaceae bacterium]|nr:hypothetical protein [Defluviitaleaceae bacterium]
MKNDSKFISANEINKFLYCPYQWYYERLYGMMHIRGLYKERNQKLGLEDTAYSNFKKGLDYHESYEDKPSDSSGGGLRLLRRVAIVIAIISGIICGYLFYHYFL